MKRHSISKGKSKRLFSKTASMTHKRNLTPAGRVVMRGGIRL